jgi:hypothetical protein
MSELVPMFTQIFTSLPGSVAIPALCLYFVMLITQLFTPAVAFAFAFPASGFVFPVHTNHLLSWLSGHYAWVAGFAIMPSFTMVTDTPTPSAFFLALNAPGPVLPMPAYGSTPTLLARCQGLAVGADCFLFGFLGNWDIQNKIQGHLVN